MDIKKVPKNIILKNGKIIDPFNKNTFIGNLWIQNGRIAGVGDFELPKTSDIHIVNCKNKIITHGFCDLHAHFREPGEEDKENLETGSRSALAGGFTRVCVMPNTSPPIDSPELIRYIIEKSKDLPIYINPIGAITKNQNGKNLTEMALMHQEGAVAFSDDGLPVQDGGVMRIALEYSKLLNIPMINHAEDECIRDSGLMNESIISTHLGLHGNPDIAESIMIQRDLELAIFTRANLHIPHVSSKKSIDHINRVKSKGNITVEVTPHHLFFNDEDLLDYDTNLKVAPPIRTEEDRIALIAGLKNGIIDCIATDHAPHRLEEKDTTFDIASCGMIGLESCFGSVNKVLVKDNNFKLEKLIDLLTLNPRNIMGFESDLFSIGASAEVVVLDPEFEWVFSKDDIESRSVNSPFIGRTLIGKVIYTISRDYISNLN